jgi:hypothetical protein
MVAAEENKTDGRQRFRGMVTKLHWQSRLL